MNARLNKRWSRARLAKRAGVAASTVYRLENLGQGNITKVGRICQALGFTIEEVRLPDEMAESLQMTACESESRPRA